MLTELFFGRFHFFLLVFLYGEFFAMTWILFFSLFCRVDCQVHIFFGSFLLIDL